MKFIYAPKMSFLKDADRVELFRARISKHKKVKHFKISPKKVSDFQR
jgi:hypothetical protein